jgi:hypothetical protein
VALSITLWPSHEDSASVAAVKQESPLPLEATTQPKPTYTESTIGSNESVQPKSEILASASTSAPKPKKEIIRQPNPEQQIEAVKKEKVIEEPVITKAAPEVIIAEVETQTSQEEVIAEPNQQEAGQVTGTSITYSAEEVNARFRKKVTPPDATIQKKSASGFMKVIDTAFDFKNDGSILGELRDKKNELLSFNGPADTRDTNK